MEAHSLWLGSMISWACISSINPSMTGRWALGIKGGGLSKGTVVLCICFILDDVCLPQVEIIIREDVVVFFNQAV